MLYMCVCVDQDVVVVKSVWEPRMKLCICISRHVYVYMFYMMLYI